MPHLRPLLTWQAPPRNRVGGGAGGIWRRAEGSAAEVELAAGDGQMDAQRTG